MLKNKGKKSNEINNEKSSMTKTIEALHLDATIYIASRRFVDAITTLNAIIKLDKNNADAYTKLAAIYFTTSNYEYAHLMHSQAIACGANDPNNYFQRGFSYVMSKRYQEAIEDFQTAKAVGGCDLAIDVNMVVCYRRLGDPQKAIDILQSIDLTNKNLTSKELFSIYKHYAKAYFELNKPKESLKYFLKAETLLILSSDIYVIIANLYKELGNDKKYFTYLGLAEKHKSEKELPKTEEANIYFQYGINYLLKENYQPAIDYLKISSKAGGLVGRELGITYQKQGNLLEANGNLAEASKSYLDASDSYDKIIEELTQRKIEVNPRHYYERGLINLKLNPTKALEDFELAKKLEELEEQINKIKGPTCS